jgi:hypothetical protein
MDLDFFLLDLVLGFFARFDETLLLLRRLTISILVMDLVVAFPGNESPKFDFLTLINDFGM